MSDNDHQHVVLLGASRMQLGFSTDTFRRQYHDHQLTQLAIEARAPVAALRDLANDNHFRGIVICAIHASHFQRRKWDDQQEYVDFYHDHYALRHALDNVIGALLQDHLVVLTPHVRIESILHQILTRGSLPEPSYIIMRADRSRPADYSLLDIEAHRQARIERVKANDNDVPTPESWMKDVEQVEEFVQQIQNRGGRVVFVRFPTTDEHWEIDQTRFPRRKYWDRMAAFTSAETIHFANYPSLSRFELPDTSHLDGKDAPAFTAALLEVLVRRGVLPDHDEE